MAQLPEPLLTEGGKPVSSVEAWETRRRPEILELFAKHVYGRAPSQKPSLSSEILSEDSSALDGLATRQVVRLTLSYEGRSLPLDVLFYLPNDANGPVPACLMANFEGNHAVTEDPQIPLPSKSSQIPGKQAVPRGANARRFPLQEILGRGYALVTVPRNDIDPDFHDGFRNGVHGLMDGAPADPRPADAWGSVAAWAWGLQRVMDYLEDVPQIDGRRVVLLGHSRLGKAALWAGAQDPRFAMVVSNDSGNSGAALARRDVGESIEVINRSFPHWFADNYKAYSGRPEALPVDQHMLLALIAPRPLYVASASEDEWADPQGEFLSLVHAGPVYALYGYDPLRAGEWPKPGHAVSSGPLAYHLREGKHDLLAWDWTRFLDFADPHLR